MTWSDHNPIRIWLKSPLFRSRQLSWCLNESILSDPVLVAAIRQTIQDYFTTNETEHTCWEAHKAVLPGHFIALCSERKKAHAKADLYNIRQGTQDTETPRRSEAIQVYLTTSGLRQLGDSDRETLDAPSPRNNCHSLSRRRRRASYLDQTVCHYYIIRPFCRTSSRSCTQP
ncbi:Hypothetical predicted protein [Pelobates cultripes]|uniref:Uncharacterized protein n=1 Tax=Pelobates cultripes TaxID=61616 RepID=A0AAD1RYS2_PELCU|nr:Hypothetical predicted protein [Pelobates cultripes]